MKSILLVFLLNAILFVSAQYTNDVYNGFFIINVPGCQNGTLELNQCSYYCDRYGAITGGYNNLYQYTVFLDSKCTKLAYIEDTNTPFIIPFNCSQVYNQIGANGLVQCSNPGRWCPSSSSSSSLSSSSTSFPLSFSSSSLIKANYTFIIISILLILFIFKNN